VETFESTPKGSELAAELKAAGTERKRRRALSSAARTAYSLCGGYQIETLGWDMAATRRSLRREKMEAEWHHGIQKRWSVKETGRKRESGVAVTKPWSERKSWPFGS